MSSDAGGTADHRFPLSGKTALVTGGGSGLGARIVRAFAAAGASVYCADVNESSASHVAEAIVSAGGAAQPIACDVACAQSVARMAVHLAGTCVDILINNAGIVTKACPTHEMPEADWDRGLAVNLKGAFLCARAVLPGMIAAGGGSIVNVSSILGPRGYWPGFAAVAANYSASKAGLVGLTRQLAVEYAHDGIRVNAVCPGFHEGTALGMEWRAHRTPEQARAFAQSVERRTPLGRQGTPEEMSALVVYLASDAARYVTGQIIAHDGGWTAA